MGAEPTSQSRRSEHRGLSRRHCECSGRVARFQASAFIRATFGYRSMPLPRALGNTWSSQRCCPGGKERMRRLMEVIASNRVDLMPLVTHRVKLDDIEKAYDLFYHQRDGVLKVAITP